MHSHLQLQTSTFPFPVSFSFFFPCLLGEFYHVKCYTFNINTYIYYAPQHIYDNDNKRHFITFLFFKRIFPCHKNKKKNEIFFQLKSFPHSKREKENKNSNLIYYVQRTNISLFISKKVFMKKKEFLILLFFLPS